MKPRLVDYSLFHKPKPKLKKKIISPPKPKLNYKENLSYIINIIGIANQWELLQVMVLL